MDPHPVIVTIGDHGDYIWFLLHILGYHRVGGGVHLVDASMIATGFRSWGF